MTRCNPLYAILLSAFMLFTANAGVEIIEDNRYSTRFKIEFDQPEVRDFGGGYTLISLDGFGHCGEEYGPALYGRAFSVAVPRGSETGLTVVAREWGEWRPITPVPYCREVFEEGLIVPGDYGLFSVSSGGSVSLIGKKVIRGVQIADIDVMPVEYDPALGVRFMKSLTLALVHRGGGETAVEPALYHPTFENLYRAILVNPNSALPKTRPFEAMEWDPEDGAELLVVCYPSYADELQPWLDWKQLMGFPTKLVTTTETGTTKASIKAYIQNAYDTWTLKPAFVLFVGDAELVATHSDWGDATLGDNEYGCVDGGDIFPDIFPGRLSCDLPSQVETMVQKHLNYERYPSTTDNWWARALGIVNEDDPYDVPLGPMDSSYLAAVTYGMGQCVSAGFVSAPILRRANGDSYSTARPYVEAGLGFVQYRGQAWPDYYYSFAGGLDTLNNNGKCPINVSISCGTGDFYSADNRMSERSTRAGTAAAPKGAVAFMGQSAVSSNSKERSSLSKHVFEGFFEADLNPISSAHVYGKTEMYAEFSGSSAALFEFRTGVMLGSPEMLAWTAPLQTPTVTHPSVIPVGSSAVDVEVRAGGVAVKNARVAIHKGSGFYYAMTGTAGTAAIPVVADPSIPMVLVVTGPNIYPYQDTIDVLVAGVGIYTAPVSFVDVVGDGDGIINPGETIRFIPRICNLGTETASGLTGVFRCGESIIWIDSTTAFPTVTAGDTVSGDEVRFRVPETFGSIERMSFYMTISGHPEGPWVRAISPEPAVHRFSALFESATVNDPGPLGNGDGALTAGELAHVCLTFDNTSEARITGVISTLLGDTKASVVQSLASAPTWDGGAEVTFSPCFTLSLSPTLEPAEPINLRLVIRGTGSIYTVRDTVPVTLYAGGNLSNHPTGPDGYGYYIIDDTDLITRLEPTYAWTDISTIGYELSPISDCDDCVTTIGLPFTMKFYGVNYDSATFAANGYMAPGRSTYSGAGTGTPQHFPTVGGPVGIVAPIWSDLAPHRTDGGEIYAYNDVTNNQFVVQWDQCKFYYAGGVVTYQLKICNPAFWATPTGDSEFYIYYREMTGLGVMGIGMESASQVYGLEYFLDGVYDVHAAVVAAERALRITTIVPTEAAMPWLYSVGAPVIDDSLGNNNRLVEPGETIGIRLNVKNGGPISSPNTRGIVLDTTYITSLRDEATYGTIVAGGTSYNLTSPMHLIVSASCPTGSVVPVPIKLSTLAGWYTSYTMVWLHVGSSVGMDESPELPTGIELSPAYPNPFNSTANITFSVGVDIDEPVRLEVFDITGRRIASLAEGAMKPGRYSVRWDAGETPSGCYFARLKAGSIEKSVKLLLIR